MNIRNFAIATTGALFLCGCAASHSLHPRPLVARASIHGMSRLQTHRLLAGYCTSHGYGIVHDSLSALACSKRLDGAAKSYLAQPLDAGLEPYTPVRTLHFRFVPDRAGAMRIMATASISRADRHGVQQRSASPLEDVSLMLRQSRAAWYARHPEYAGRDRT